jgi:hypothetical protein
VNVLGLLRVLYIALALVIGFGLTAAGVLSLLDLIQVAVSGASYLDSPLPFSFSSHVYTPAIGAVSLLSALMALRERWHALALACWFLLATGVMDALYMIWSLGRHGVVPESVASVFVAVWVFFPMLGLLLAAGAKPREDKRSDAPASASAQEWMRLRTTLIGLVAVSYIWRAITMWVSPGMTYAIAYLQGMSDLYGPEQVVLSGVVGLCAAIVLVACVAVSRKGSDGVMQATLAFTAGFAFEGFLDTLDFFFRFGSLRELNYALQDAVAFVACCAALALSVLARGPSSRPATV